MKKIFLILLLSPAVIYAQQNLTPEMLWQLGRVNGIGLSANKQTLVYSVTTPDVSIPKSNTVNYALQLPGGSPVVISKPDSLITNNRISPDGKWIIKSEKVKVNDVLGKDLYPDLTKSNVYVYDNLAYRHWDTWSDGGFDHVMLAPLVDGKPGTFVDIMKSEPYDCPQKPFGGDEDFIWSPDSKQVIYVTKKKFGTAYAISTNTDIYAYDLATGKTTDLTEGMMGYDINPAFNHAGEMAWLSMRRDGYEADKQDLYVQLGKNKINLTGSHDELHVESFRWSDNGMIIYFTAPIDGTIQLFEIDLADVKVQNANNALNNATGKLPRASGSLSASTIKTRQITKGDFDVASIVGEAGNSIIVSRTDMNHATELFKVERSTGIMQQLTQVNTARYNQINMSKTERRMVKTTDGKDMLVWVIYPPNFDKYKKYPTLLYCQGGPQSSLTQSYSFRWNFQLMAANGYIIVAPNRRGMPGHGTLWNEKISKDWGGQVMQDYLSAIDAVSKESYVDKSRLGCVGASYGGYSVYYLAGNHNNRFKTFIAHDGVFDFRSMYGTTEEVWFVNWDIGGGYWEKNNAAAQKSYLQFSPSNFVDKWNTPILIYQGGRDYRVPIEQGLQAFQAAQLRGIKSRLVYLPDENHWVLNAQNALVWQHEFYKWLRETLK